MENFDIIILGAGPAGISAGIYAVRAGAKVLVLDNGESALKSAKLIQNYYGIESISGEEMINNGIEQFKKLGGSYEKCEVVQIKNDEDAHTFIVKANKEYLSKAIILANGRGKKKTIAGLEPFKDANVSYCAICDGFFYLGKDVAVIGDGDFALDEAEELSKNAKTVYLIAKNGIKNKKISKNIKVVEKNIEKFTGDGLVENIVLEDGENLKIDGVFVALGSLSSVELAMQLGIMTNANSIIVDKNFMTNVAGVFAAGDCIGGLLQVSKAVGDGAVAGIEAVRYIKVMEGNE